MFLTELFHWLVDLLILLLSYLIYFMIFFFFTIYSVAFILTSGYFHFLSSFQMFKSFWWLFRLQIWSITEFITYHVSDLFENAILTNQTRIIHEHFKRCTLINTYSRHSLVYYLSYGCAIVKPINGKELDSMKLASEQYIMMKRHHLKII